MIFSQVHSRVPGGPAVAAVIAVSFCEVPFAFAVFIEPDGLVAMVVPGLPSVGLCTVKKVHEFPVSSRDVTNQTPPEQE
jgi:hypothetical protein